MSDSGDKFSLPRLLQKAAEAVVAGGSIGLTLFGLTLCEFDNSGGVFKPVINVNYKPVITISEDGRLAVDPNVAGITPERVAEAAKKTLADIGQAAQKCSGKTLETFVATSTQGFQSVIGKDARQCRYEICVIGVNDRKNDQSPNARIKLTGSSGGQEFELAWDTCRLVSATSIAAKTVSLNANTRTKIRVRFF